MLTFRVDKRTFNVGDIITPQTNFEHCLKGEVLEVEKLLDKYRPPQIPERKKCLFLFMELFGALRFWSKYGGTIYRVCAEKILHRGDMNKLDNILDLYRYIGDDDREGIVIAAVNEYWKCGTHTFQPCYEILVEKAEVRKVICIDSELENFKEEFLETNSIERTTLYKNLLMYTDYK